MPRLMKLCRLFILLLSDLKSCGDGRKPELAMLCSR